MMTAAKHLLSLCVGGASYLALFILIQWLYGNTELLVEWDLGRRRELVEHLTEHVLMISLPFILGYLLILTSMLLPRLATVIVVLAIAIFIYFWSGTILFLTANICLGIAVSVWTAKGVNAL